MISIYHIVRFSLNYATFSTLSLVFSCLYALWYFFLIQLSVCFSLWNKVFYMAKQFVQRVETLCSVNRNTLFYRMRTKCFYTVKQNVFVWWNKVFLYNETKCSPQWTNVLSRFINKQTTCALWLYLQPQCDRYLWKKYLSHLSVTL